VATLQDVEWTVRATLGGHVSAVDRAITYCGRNRWAWDKWRRKIGEGLSHGPSIQS
jgi:hypothetical protein